MKTFGISVRQIVWVVLIIQSYKHFGFLLGSCMCVLVARVAILDLERFDREEAKHES